MRKSKKGRKSFKDEFRILHQLERWERYAPYAVAVLTITAFLLRVYRVDFLSLWVDEYVHVVRAKGVLNDKPLFTDDNNGIFLTLLIIFNYLIFGMSELTSRMPSVLLGTLVTPLIYILGKLLFNRSVGFLAALLSTVSLYSIFWSRVARNYASFEFFYLLLIVFFYLLMEQSALQERQNTPVPGDRAGRIRKVRGWLERNQISPKYLVLTLIALILSMLNHQLTFLFVLSVLCYGSLVAIVRIAKKEKDRFSDKHAVLLYPALAVILLFFFPFFNDVVRPILGLFLPEWAVSWVVPRWDIILADWNSPERFAIFNMYVDVLKNDFGNFWYIGLVGILATLYLDWKKGTFLASMFVLPFLLMSFLFRDPATPRYLIYVYPVFLLYTAVGFFVFLVLLARWILSISSRIRRYSQKLAITAAVVVLLLYAPWNETFALLMTQKHGRVVKRELSYWYFSHWREAYDYLQANIQSEDVIVSTFPASGNFYLDRENTIWFRQRHFDPERLDYVPNEPTGNRGQSAWTYEEFLETVQMHSRGWVIADNYLYNVMTDPRARDYIFQTMEYHFGASIDGTVFVFNWNHRSSESPKAFILEVGKMENLSTFIPVTVKAEQTTSAIAVTIDCEGIDSDREAYLVVNRIRSI